MRRSLPRTPVRAGLLLAGLLLAGCAAPVPGREDAEAPVGVVLADLTSSSCFYNDLIFLVPRDQVQALLPDGFVARAAFSEAPQAGGIVTNVIHCEDGWGWSGADFFALVDRVVPPPEIEAFDATNRTPRVDGDGPIWLDLYMLGVYTQHEGLTEIFARGGMTAEPAQVAKTVVPAPVGSAARGAVTDGAGAIVTYSVTGRDVGELTASHRQWRETPEGLLLLERFMSIDGGPLVVTQGPANCVVRAGSTLAQTVGDIPCSLGQDSTNGMAWDGRAYLFPGASAASFPNANG